MSERAGRGCTRGAGRVGPETASAAPGQVPSPPPLEPLRAAGGWPRPGFEESPPETAGLSFPEFPEPREEEAAQPRIPNSAGCKNSLWPN